MSQFATNSVVLHQLDRVSSASMPIDVKSSSKKRELHKRERSVDDLLFGPPLKRSSTEDSQSELSSCSYTRETSRSMPFASSSDELSGRSYRSVTESALDHVFSQKSIPPSVPILITNTCRTERTARPVRHVSFSPDAKRFDGLHPAARLLDRLLLEFIVKQHPVNVPDVVKMAQGDYHLLVGLRMRLMELCTRLAQAKAQSESPSASSMEFCMNDVGIPVLPAGGGSGTRLMALHLPYLVGLHKVVTSACNSVANQRTPPKNANDDSMMCR